MNKQMTFIEGGRVGRFVWGKVQGCAGEKLFNEGMTAALNAADMQCRALGWRLVTLGTAPGFGGPQIYAIFELPEGQQ